MRPGSAVRPQPSIGGKGWHTRGRGAWVRMKERVRHSRQSATHHLPQPLVRWRRLRLPKTKGPSRPVCAVVNLRGPRPQVPTPQSWTGTPEGRMVRPPPAPLAGLRSAPRGHRERRPPLCLERPRSDPGRACSLRPQRKRRPQPLHVRVPPGLARSLRTLFS